MCLEKFTCLESTARLAHAAKYAMTYPLENRSHGSLQERWSISLEIALEAAARRRRRARRRPPASAKTNTISTASRRTSSVCHIEEWETSHQKRL